MQVPGEPQLASYLINDCFGISSFFILIYLAVAGLKLMRVRVVRLWKWFYRMFIAAHLVFCFPWFRFYGPLSGLLHLSGWIAWL